LLFLALLPQFTCRSGAWTISEQAREVKLFAARKPCKLPKRTKPTRGGLVRSDRICEFLSGIAEATKLPILALAA
jgi:hypothetical protein